MTETYNYHYSDFVTDINHIKYSIQSDPEEFVPDMIIGLSRGGLTPAVALSHTMNIPMRVIEWSKSTRMINQSVAELVSGQKYKFLVVEDIVDTGELLTSLFEDWESWANFDDSYVDASKIRVASLVNHRPNHVLYENLTGSIMCRYYGRHIESKPWVSFFWETI